MNILITGVSGFLGRHIAKNLKERGHYLIGLDIYETPDNEISSFLDEYEQCNLSESNQIDNIVQKSELLIHLAGESAVNKNQSKYNVNNILATNNLVDAVKKNGLRKFIFLSSIKVGSKNKYAESKKKAENIIISGAEKKNYKYTILRCSTVYGSGMKSNLLQWLGKVKRNKIWAIPESNSVISLIGITDICKIIIGCIENSNTDSNSYIVTDGESYTINNIEKIVREIYSDHKSYQAYPKWSLFLLAKLGDIVGTFGVKFPLNTDSYNMFFNNTVIHDDKIYKDLNILPSQNFLEELPALITD